MSVATFSGQNYTGLSSDTKPTNAPVGSWFFELNTAKLFYFDGTSWNIYSRGAPERDGATGAMMTIDYPHHELHEGSAYFATHAIDLSNAQVYNYQITTPNTTKWAHVAISVISESECDGKLFESAQVSGGTSWTAYNRNRNSASTSGLTLKYGVSIGGSPEVPGTQIYELHWGSGRSNGGAARDETEFILKQNTTYRLQVTNATATANYISTVLSWYEHTNR